MSLTMWSRLLWNYHDHGKARACVPKCELIGVNDESESGAGDHLRVLHLGTFPGDRGNRIFQYWGLGEEPFGGSQDHDGDDDYIDLC